MKNKSLIKFFVLALALLGVGFFFAGCTEQKEEDSTLPWAQPTGWESNKMPATMPNYGERSY